MEVGGVMMLVQLRRVFKMCPVGYFFISVVIGAWVAGVFCCVF